MLYNDHYMQENKLPVIFHLKRRLQIQSVFLHLAQNNAFMIATLIMILIINFKNQSYWFLKLIILINQSHSY